MSLLSSPRRSLGAIALVVAVALAPLTMSPAVAAPPDCDPLVDECDEPDPICMVQNLVAPTLSGDAYVGDVLGASTGTWIGDPTLSYSWLRGEVPIEGASASTYRLRPADMGASVRARVVGTNTLCDPSSDSVETAPKGPIALSHKLGFTAFPALVWSGRFEHSMSIDPGVWSSADTPVFTYRWYRNSTTSTPIGTGQSYRPQVIDIDQAIIGQVRADAPGYAPVTHTLAGAVVLPGSAPVRNTDPSISGSPRVGSTLSVSDGGWSDAALWNVTYSWARDGLTIGGATTNTYSPTADDLGSPISAQVRLTRAGHEPGTAVAPAVIIGEGLAPVLAVEPVLLGSAQVGSLLTVSPVEWSAPVPTTVGYQWLLDGVPLPGASSTALYVEASDVGKSVALRITGERPGHESAVFTTSATTATLGSAPVATVKPSVTGTRKFGKKLTVNPGTWSTAATFTYQWYRGGTRLAGATGMSYSLGAADIGKVIGVEVRARSTGHATGIANVTTSKIGHAGKLKYSSKSKVKIKGKTKVGKKLKVSVTKKKLLKRFGPDATKVTYQWYRGSKKIKGATRSSYRLVKADRGKKVSVRVKGTRIGYLSGSVRSKSVKVAR